MIRKGQVLHGTISEASNSKGVHSVNLGGVYNLLRVTSAHPKDQYFDGQDVLLGFINPDAPQILSRGFRAPQMFSAVYPPIPPEPPFPDGMCTYRVASYWDIRLTYWPDYSQPGTDGHMYAFLHTWTRFWWTVRIEEGSNGVWLWMPEMPSYGGTHSPPPSEWGLDYYDDEDHCDWGFSYDYFSASCSLVSYETTEYGIYNEANAIEDYVQSIMTGLDAGTKTPVEIGNFYSGAFKNNFINPWNAAFPGTFSED